MKDSERAIQKRWGSALKQGFLVLPVSLLRQQHRLGIDGTELVVLLNLLANWHKDDEPVWVAYSSFAKNMGTSDRTAQRAIASLEKKGLVNVVRKPEGRVASFDGLLHRLEELELKI